MAAAAMTQSLVEQSYLLSSLDLFYLSAWLCVALIPLCFLVRRTWIVDRVGLDRGLIWTLCTYPHSASVGGACHPRPETLIGLDRLLECA